MIRFMTLYSTLPIDRYDALLTEKADKIKLLFNEFDLPEMTLYPSEPSHFRMRAEFRIWQEQNDCYPIMFDPQTKQKIKITQFPIASILINDAISQIFPLIKQSEQLKERLFQVDFLSTLKGELLITLIYHKSLTDDWIQEAKKLKSEMLHLGMNLDIIGRATKQKIILDRDYVNECFTILGKTFHYQQVENSFTQPNAKINECMLTWAINATQNSHGDLLELYCGNGNFSIALAQNFRRVLATEISKASVHSAQQNIAQNHITNLTIVRLSAEELTQAMNGVRAFNRLKGIELSDYQCQTVLVDPPRAGLDDDTLTMIQHYPKIIYISCNPLTLKENLMKLTETHEIKKMALFDQFPYTEHAEIGLILEKKSLR